MAATEPIEELERQVERSSMFLQASLDRIVGRVSGTQNYVLELVRLLRAKGVLSAEDVGETPAESASEPTEAAAGQDPGPDPAPDPAPGPNASLFAWPSVAIRDDDQDPPAPVPVNCDERLHICHAVCCKLHFALSAEEVEAGKVKWDLGFPYIIRQNSHGYCVHNDMQTGACRAYADRPGVCRTYSCANDRRIWKDFEKMELNQEWLDENLSQGTRIRLRGDIPMMQPGTAAQPPELAAEE